MIIKTVKDYQKIFNKLIEKGYGERAVGFAYDSDYFLTDEYDSEDIIDDGEMIIFTELGTLRMKGELIK